MSKENKPISLAGVRREFAVFDQQPDLAFLDNASSTQKPRTVLRRLQHFYENEYANVHRGVYELGEKATAAYEGARRRVAAFIGCDDDREIVFTRGTTEGLNLLATSLCAGLQPGDEILLTVLEHHANLVPWQIHAARRGLKVKYIPLREDLTLDLAAAAALFSPRTKIFAFSHVSNVLGVINPAQELVAMAQAYGAVTVCDGAQAVPHFPVNVKTLGCDFYVFSGHKMLGPTGIGVIYGSYDRFCQLPVYHGGGEMIERVTLDGSTFKLPPHKFEAGTPPFAQAVGLAAALDFIASWGYEGFHKHSLALGKVVKEGLKNYAAIKLYTPPEESWTGVVAFSHQGIHPHDIAAVCGDFKVCIRAGHHCAQPLMAALGVNATSRVSPYVYNTTADVERFFAAVDQLEGLFG